MIDNKRPFPLSKPSQLPEFANLLIGGVAGAGKTSLLGLVGKGNKSLIIDTEGGTSSLNSTWFRQQDAATESENLDIVSIQPDLSATELVHAVESVFDYIIRTKNSDGYALVALDSVTEFQEKFLSVHQAADKRQSYGALRESMYSIVHKARQAPAHTVFTARLKATFDEVLNREVVRPEVSPGVWSVISGLFDNIGFLELKQQGVRQIRTLNFAHQVRTQGKDRFGIGELNDPTFIAIAERLSADGDAPAVPTTPTPRSPAPRRGAATARSQA